MTQLITAPARANSLYDLVRAEQGRRKDLPNLQAYMQGTRDGMFGEDGVHWLGPRLDKSAKQYDETLQKIKQTLVIQNLVSSVIDNHTDAVTGKEIDWQLSADEAASTALTDWYYTQRVQETLQDATRTALYATRTPDETTSILRLYVPRRAVVQGRVLRSPLPVTLERAVRLMHCPPGSAGTLRDEDGEQIAGYYEYPDGETNTLELVALAGEFKRRDWPLLNPRIPDGDTVVQILAGSEYREIRGEAAYPLDGNLTIFEMSRRPLITEDVISQQDGLNTQWTYLNRHAGASAFLERVILNGMPPGRWVDELGNPDPNGKIYKPDPLEVGAGTTNFYGGVDYGDGQKTNASIAWREPGSSEPILANIRAHERAIYDLTNQLHKLISDDATASGVSRQQALNDFITSLGPTETQVKLAARWLLKTALMLGGHFEGNAGRYANVEVDAKVKLAASTPTPDEQRLAMDLYKGGVLNLEEAMRRVGVQDTAAMLELVTAEADLRFQRAQELARGREPVEEINA